MYLAGWPQFGWVGDAEKDARAQGPDASERGAPNNVLWRVFGKYAPKRRQFVLGAEV
jgi:hypothetical protein